MITKSQFIKLFPLAKEPDEWVKGLIELLPEHEINNPMRVGAFLSQIHVESVGLSVLSENLNYSSDGLLKTFKKYFPTKDIADNYARQPEKIANKVYANRMGNGDEVSGDGWLYRGRGVIQITGKSNYVAFAQDMVTEPVYVIENPHIVSDYPYFALLSAVWFWKKNGLNVIADTGDVVVMTKKINGGKNGLEHRIAMYDKTMSMFV